MRQSNVNNHLRDSYEFVIKLIDYTPMPCTMWDLEVGRFIYTNKPFLDILGYTLPELRALTFIDIIHPDDVEISMKIFRDNIANKRNMDEPFYNRYITKDGEVVWLYWSKAINDYDKDFGIGHVTKVEEKNVPLGVLAQIKK